jgi:hypothetical protein
MTELLDALKRKARQMERAFPAHFTLAKAQEATADVLGFADWHALHRAASAGKPVLPAERVGPTDPRYPATVYAFIAKMVDTYSVPAELAHGFYLSWGVFSPVLGPPFAYDFFEIADVYKQRLAGNQEAGRRDDFQEDDEIAEITPGVLEAPGPWSHKHRYWFLNPERLKAIPAPLQAMGGAYLDFEHANLVVLSFASEFEAERVARAHHWVSQFEPALYEWLFAGTPALRPRRSAGIQLKAARVAPDAWFPLSLRYRALPFVREARRKLTAEVVSATQGRNLAQMIETKGLVRLADVRWFAGSHLSLLTLDDSFRPLDLQKWQECEPQHASPFKRGPLWDIELSASEAGEGLGWHADPESQDEA